MYAAESDFGASSAWRVEFPEAEADRGGRSRPICGNGYMRRTGRSEGDVSLVWRRLAR